MRERCRPPSKGGQKRFIRLGWGRVPVLFFVLGILSLSVFLPYWILLKAALFLGDAAVSAWHEWINHYNFNALGFALVRKDAQQKAGGTL